MNTTHIMNTIPEILEELRAGRTILLVDDERRENEGDLICAAEYTTDATINFMLKRGRGMLFVGIDGASCERLDLPPQAAVNTTQRGTAYTISVDAIEKYGLTTGVSAADRATTVQKLADPNATAADFDRPGHIQPVRARDGGTLVRTGHTEGMTDLCRLAGLRPVAVGIEVMNDDGKMARMPDLMKLAAEENLKICSVADVIEYRLAREKLIERLDSATLDTEFGEFKLIAYRSRVDPMPHVALVLGDLGELGPDGLPIEHDDPILVRMHSQNLLGDVFGDRKQPSGETLQTAMRMIQKEGRGAIVYLRHEKMGTGLLQTLQSRQKQDADSDGGGSDANPEQTELGELHPTPGTRPPAAKGAYGIGSQILRDLGVRHMRLLTNHPFHPTALSGFGLEITEFVPVEA